MKTSNKILWGSWGGLLGIALLFLVALRLLLGGNVESHDEPLRKAVHGLREIAMVDFSGVDLQGHWQAEVVQGAQEQILVEGAEDLLAALFVRRRGDSLALQMSKQPRDARKLRATITMSVLRSLRTK